MNYSELMQKLNEYGGALEFLNKFKHTFAEYNLTPELIASILERGEQYEHIQPRSNARITSDDN